MSWYESEVSSNRGGGGGWIFIGWGTKFEFFMIFFIFFGALTVKRLVFEFKWSNLNLNEICGPIMR
jgi:hypothetical protein